MTEPLNTCPPNPRAIRLALGRSLLRVAADAETSTATIKLFELSPESGVTNEQRRQRIAATYARMAAELSAQGGR